MSEALYINLGLKTSYDPGKCQAIWQDLVRSGRPTSTRMRRVDWRYFAAGGVDLGDRLARRVGGTWAVCFRFVLFFLKSGRWGARVDGFSSFKIYQLRGDLMLRNLGGDDRRIFLLEK